MKKFLSVWNRWDSGSRFLLFRLFPVAAISALQYAISFAQCNELFISEYVEGWSNNKALEIYNPTIDTVNISGYRIARYSNGQDVPPAQTNWVVALSGTIAPYGTKVLVIDKRNPAGTGQEAPVWDELDSIGSLPGNLFLCPDYVVSEAMYFNGDDAVALETTAGVIIDLIGKIGEQPVNASGGTSSPTGGWTDVAPYNTGQGNFYTVDQTLVRKFNIKQSVTVNPSAFNPAAEWDRFNANTFSNLGSHSCECNPASVNEPLTDRGILFFPNPVNTGSLTVKAASDISSVEISNVLGHVVFSHTYTNNYEVNIELPEIVSGIYIVKVNFESYHRVTKKIAVK